MPRAGFGETLAPGRTALVGVAAAVFALLIPGTGHPAAPSDNSAYELTRPEEWTIPFEWPGRHLPEGMSNKGRFDLALDGATVSAAIAMYGFTLDEDDEAYRRTLDSLVAVRGIDVRGPITLHSGGWPRKKPLALVADASASAWDLATRDADLGRKPLWSRRGFMVAVEDTTFDITPRYKEVLDSQRPLIRRVARAIDQSLERLHLDREATLRGRARLGLSYVQSRIDYRHLREWEPAGPVDRYCAHWLPPLQMLMGTYGDCDSKAICFLALWREWYPDQSREAGEHEAVYWTLNCDKESIHHMVVGIPVAVGLIEGPWAVTEVARGNQTSGPGSFDPFLWQTAKAGGQVNGPFPLR